MIRVLALLVAFSLQPSACIEPAFAQTATPVSGTTLSGKVTQGENNLPMAGALVVIDELRREVRAGEDGTFVFEGVPPGQYHVGVRAEGYTTKRTEVTVGTTPATVNMTIDFDLHFAEVLSVSPNARPQFESGPADHRA